MEISELCKLFDNKFLKISPVLPCLPCYVMLAEICAISTVKFDEEPRRKKYSNAGRKLNPGLCVSLDIGRSAVNEDTFVRMFCFGLQRRKEE